MTLKKNSSSLLCPLKLCGSFQCHLWILIWVIIRKHSNLSKIIWALVTLTFDLWPWPLAWTSLLAMAIIPENFMINRWEKHCQKGMTEQFSQLLEYACIHVKILFVKCLPFCSSLNVFNSTCLCNQTTVMYGDQNLLYVVMPKARGKELHFEVWRKDLTISSTKIIVLLEIH